MTERIAIIYQSKIPPERNGNIKPMKLGGYSDSGADIAYSLQSQKINIVTPVENPKVDSDLDWVFPDSAEGIQSAIDKGATIIWLNTVLYKGHPIENFIKKGISVVGQIPENVDLYDDKWVTNNLLKSKKLPIPKSIIITPKNSITYKLDFPFPVVVKPILGRGSQGVSIAKNLEELNTIINSMLNSQNYGEALYVEDFLSGEEITITIMPPGNYIINNKVKLKNDYWCLPAVKRFNHKDGIAPYNGTVAIINNSKVLTDKELENTNIKQVCKYCIEASKLVNAKAPIRIDCRANTDGKYFLFDLNMKPNMTGASRPHRQDQNSLTALSAQKIGWTFDDLILNIFNQHWKQ